MERGVLGDLKWPDNAKINAWKMEELVRIKYKIQIKFYEYFYKR